MNATIVNMMPEKSADSVVLPQQGKEVQQSGTKGTDTDFSKVLKTVSGDNSTPADKAKTTQNEEQRQDENSDDAKLSGVEGILPVVPMVQLPILINDIRSSTTQLSVPTVETASPTVQNVPLLNTVQAGLGEGLTVNSDSLLSGQTQSAVPQEPVVLLNNKQEQTVSSNGKSNVLNDKIAVPNGNALNNVLEVEKTAPEIPTQSNVPLTIGMKLSEDIPKAHYSVYGMKVVPGKKTGMEQNSSDPLLNQLSEQEATSVTEGVVQTTMTEQGKAVLPDVKSAEVVQNAVAAEQKNLTVPETATLTSMSIQSEHEQNKSSYQLAASKRSNQSAVSDDSLDQSMFPADDLQNGSKMVVNNLKNAQPNSQEVNPVNLTASKFAQTGFSELSTLTSGLVKQSGQDKTDALPNSSDNSTSYTHFSAQLQKSDPGIGVSANEVKAASAPMVNDHYNVVSQIVEHAKMVNRTNNSEMVIQLKPEHLGELTLKVLVENGSVSTTFHSNNPDVRSVIEASLNQLRQEMSNQGLKVDYVGVYAGLSQFSSQQQRESQQQPVYKFQNKKQINEFGESLEAVSQVSSSEHADGVDYRI